MTQKPARIAWAVGSLVVGVAIGLAGAFIQAQRSIVDLLGSTTAFPWGLLIAVAVLLVAIRGATWGMRSRWGGWLLLAGWLVATIAMAAESPSGDVALSGGGRQMTYLLAGVILGSAAATLRLPRSREI